MLARGPALIRSKDEGAYPCGLALCKGGAASTLSITGDTTLRLGHFFGTSAQFWLNLQSLYDLQRAQENSGNPSGHFPG
jgi:hypothetical protein